MSQFETPIDPQMGPSESAGARSRFGPQLALMPGFTFSIFLSALLLFSVQPMFAKMTLPLLGGAPNVWNTAMVFFQATLLAGYVYAHYLSKYASLRTQVVVHALVLLSGIIFLPLGVANGWTPPDQGAPALWLIALYGASIGLPFFALSATAPLLQRWFSYTSHENAQDPYFLYAASNLGSLMSLLAYPVLIEPLLGVSQQSDVWTLGYFALAIAIICSGALAFVNRLSATSATSETKTDAASADQSMSAAQVSWAQKALWIGLAFVPSSLMLGVTTHFATNVASAPFVWVAPLALYLATFVFVFASKPLISEDLTAKLLPFAVVAGLLFVRTEGASFFVTLGAHLMVFFVIALRFHGRLAATRPAPEFLTIFYICMSVGGVLGGIFNALIAPIIFDGIAEYFLILTISGLAAAGEWGTRKSMVGDLLFAVATFAVLTLVIVVLRRLLPDMSFLVNIALLAAYVVAMLYNRRPLRFFGALLAVQVFMMTLAPSLFHDGEHEVIFRDRSFFGVTKVTAVEENGEITHRFISGNTIHNTQFRRPDLQKTLIAYFSEYGAYGQVMEAVRKRADRPLTTHVIGLGAGALACYAKPGDDWVFYEIDPAIAAMARNPKYFTYLSECLPGAPIELGDARIKIQNVAGNSVDLLIIDAFSSDAIPAHLVTREAMALYQSVLKDDGVILFHTSNRFADVSSVVLALAEDAGLSARELQFEPTEEMEFHEFISPQTGVVVASQEIMAATFDAYPDWKANKPNPAVGVWTDDYSHIIGALMAARDGGPIKVETVSQQSAPALGSSDSPQTAPAGE